MWRSDRRLEGIIARVLYVTVVTLLYLPAGTLRAQEPSSQSLREARRLEMESRQRALWYIGKEAHKKTGEKIKTSPAQLLAYQQFTEDFESLQVTNYALVDAVGLKSGLDYGEIKKHAAEVKKRASRLKDTLLLPEPGKDEKQKNGGEPLSFERLRVAVSDMNVLVQSFVTSALFQQLGTVDANHSTKARRDLDSIIRLSEQIRKSAEALNRLAGKNL